MRTVALLIAPLVLTGCLASKLKQPAADHYLQTRAIAERCLDAGRDDCDDLVAMCDQAEAIVAITRGRDARQCIPGGDD